MGVNVPIQREPAPGAQDHSRLVRATLARTQALSGDVWTDYNSHDPGVTLIEALCFGINDVAYRAGHNFGDLLASSMAHTGIAADELPLVPGNHSLTCAPVTRNDYRKLIFDRVFGVKNVWLRPDPSAPGQQEVLVHSYPQPLHGPRTQPADDVIVAEVQTLLQRFRHLGEEITAVQAVPQTALVFEAEIEIAPNTHAEDRLAALLLAVEDRLNPAPLVRDLDSQLRSGRPTDRIFEGPQLDLGVIDDASLTALNTDISRPAVLRAMLAVPGIMNVRLDTLPDPDGGLPVAPRVPEDLAGLRVMQAGRQRAFDADRVLFIMRHMEQTKRYGVLYEMKTLRDQAYTRLPLGRVRPLARYRSIQYFLPAAYGVGPQGMAAAAGLFLDAGNDPNGSEAKRARLAQMRQLKGYLLPFEQVLADALSQLANMAVMFSTRARNASYFGAPLVGQTGQAGPSPDLTPENEPLLTHGTNAAGYAAAHHALQSARDPWRDRRERAFDHLLARIDERFDDARVSDLGGSGPSVARQERRVELKRQFLSDHTLLQAERGNGIDLADPEAPVIVQAARRAQVMCDLDAPPLILENVLLNDAAPYPGIGTLTVAKDLRVSDGRAPFRLPDPQPMPCGCDGPCRNLPEPVWAVGLAGGLHGVLGAGKWPDMIGPLAEALAADPPLALRSGEGYRLGLSLRFADMALHLIETAASRAHARALLAPARTAAKAWLDGSGTPCAMAWPVMMPAAGSRHRLTTMVKARSESHAAFAAETLVASVPAHLTVDCFTLSDPEAICFADHHAAWLKAQRARRAPRSSDELPSLRTAAAAESARMALWLHRLHGRRFLARLA